MFVLALGAVLLSSAALALPRPYPAPAPLPRPLPAALPSPLARPRPDTVPGGIRGPAFACPLGFNCDIGGCPPFLGCGTPIDCFPYPGFPYNY